MSEEHQRIALALVAHPAWEWREGMLHGEADPTDKVFAYYARCNSDAPPRSHYGNRRLPVLTDAPTGGAMLDVYAKYLRTSPMMTLGLVLDMVTGRNLDVSTITLGEAVALGMLRERP